MARTHSRGEDLKPDFVLPQMESRLKHTST